MVDQRPVLYEVLAQISNNKFPFQQHLEATCDLLPPQPVCVFFHLNNSSGNKWFNFKIPPRSVYTIIHFSSMLSNRYPRPIVLEFIMFWPKGGLLAYKSIIIPNLSIIFPNFFYTTLYSTWTTLIL